MVQRRLRYNGFSFFARTLWAIENPNGGSKVTYRRVIERIDELEFWTDELSQQMREWYKEMAGKYMTTNRFEMEKIRFRLRKKAQGKMFLEDPVDWFNAEVLKPSEWSVALTTYAMYNMKDEAKKAAESRVESQDKKDEVKPSAPPKNNDEGEDDEDDSDKESYYTQDSY